MGISTKPVAADWPFVGSVCKSCRSHFISVFLLSSLEKRGRVDIIMTTYIMQRVVRETQSVQDEMT